MTEADLKELKFKKNRVSAEDSGDKPFHFYTYDFFKGPFAGLSLISCCDEDAKGDKWYVEVFEEPRIRFTEKAALRSFITLVKTNKRKGRRA